MVDNVGDFVIVNGIVKPSDRLSFNTQGTISVYEVIRIIEGTPLFIEDHYVRLKNSLELINIDLSISKQNLKEQIQKLVDANHQINCNIKVVALSEFDKQNHYMYINKSYYPNSEEVDNGVKVSLFSRERETPNLKLINNTYKDEVAKRINKDSVFEVLLVNNENKITEGSKSNVFFVKGEKVFTSPGEYILKGITRQYIIDICKKTGLDVIETLISSDSLADMEGLFIAGTSIKVMPVSDVNGRKFKSSIHPTIALIRNQFDKLIDEYISGNRIK